MQDAASDAVHGKDPSDALGRLGGEVQRAGAKAADQASDKVTQLKDDAQDKVSNLKRDTDQQLR